MGQVAITLKVMPESADVDVHGLKSQINKAVSPKQIIEKPIGFGLTMLEVLLVFDDREGAGEAEEKIRLIEGVGSVETGDVTLL